ncbi:MAG: VOC family protein [Chloroflexota bacterium]
MTYPKIDQQITFIYVTDLQASANFYEKIMGFKLWLDQGSCRIYSVSNDGLIGICQIGEGAKGSFATNGYQNLILTLVSAEVEAWYDFLTSQGLECEHPPQTNEKYNIYHFFVHDPDGYIIEIQRFLKQ